MVQTMSQNSGNYAEDERKIRQLEGNLDVLDKKVKDYERIETGLKGEFDRNVKNVAKFTAVQNELLKRSLKNFWLKLIKKYDKLYEENNKNLDKAQDELDKIKYRLSDTRGRLRDVKSDYDNFKKQYDAQRDYMKRQYTEFNAYEKQIVDERAKLSAMIKEIDEASVAVDEVKGIAVLALDKYKKAEGWGYADIMIGGMMSDIVKYNQINSAESYIYTLNASIARMNKELNDVNNVYGVYCQQFGGSLQFADICFDNIFADAAVLRRIQLNIQSLTNFISQLDMVKENLAANKRQVLQKLQ
ncbi:MAG: hypothetical protein PUB67_01345 [Clostridiales bacterium]|nr:hypothetical protein [Clostridiales bacterium]